ncbi:MAG: NAD-dependent epimerase/dehydratase family protein [Ignavibacteria bacterium]|nr:NAD-dependent epimerase/dehydratase family protein [Ignavibacteria bacterium]
MKTAILIGATGLVGTHLLNILISNNNYKKIIVFTRRELPIKNPMLAVNLIDFEKISMWKNKIIGDDLFSCLGTTIRKAGSKEDQYKVDFTYQYEIAKAAAENGVKRCLLVSSAGANHSSKNFYLNIKGKLEKEVEKLPFENIIIFQPSLLVGNREEPRIGEKIGAFIFSPIAALIPPLRKYRPIKAETVARAMINSANQKQKNKLVTFALNQIFSVANK